MTCWRTPPRDAQGHGFERVDCHALLEEVLSNLRLAVEESRAVVTHDVRLTVMADRGQLGQVFQNLIGNAVKFRGQEPPWVHISAEHKDAEWRFAIRDTRTVSSCLSAPAR